MTEPNCQDCHDTGSTQKRMDADYLDCGRCDVFTKRAEFDAWALVNLPADRDAALWLAYLHGQGAAPDKLDSYNNAKPYDVQRGSRGYSSGDEILAEDIGFVQGWNACVDAINGNP